MRSPEGRVLLIQHQAIAGRAVCTVISRFNTLSEVRSGSRLEQLLRGPVEQCTVHRQNAEARSRA